MFKNTSGQKVSYLCIDTATNLPKTGDAANLTAYVSKDDGTVTILGDTSATEKDATNAPGLYDFDLTQAETNADKLVFSGKSSTSGVRLVPITLYTVPPSFSSLTITGGNVTVGTNNDKTGYSLSGTQTFNVTGNITGNLSGSVGSVSGAVGSVTGDVNGKVIGGGATAITGVGVNANVTQVNGVPATTSDGTAQAGASGSITLASGASSVNNTYVDRTVTITGGTGFGQSRVISAYVGSTKVATVLRNWDTAPDNTSTYSIGATSVTSSVGTGGITASSLANDAITDAKVASDVTIASVTGSVGSVTAGVTVTTNNDKTGYTVSTVTDKTGYSLVTAPPTAAAIATAVWTTTTSSDFATTSSPGKILVTQLGGAFSTTSSSVYSTASLTNAPSGTGASAAVIAAAVWDEAKSAHTTSGSFGANLDAAVSSRLAPTVASRTLDVSATGEAGIDWANIGSPTTAVVLSGTTVGTITAYTGNTPQTGDSFALIGATGSGLTSLATASGQTAIKAKTDSLTFTVSNKLDATVAGYAANQDPATILYASTLVNTTTLKFALRAMAAVLSGVEVKASDGSTASFRDIGDASGAFRVTSVNTSTLRTPTVV